VAGGLRGDRENEEIVGLFFAVMRRFRGHFLASIAEEGITESQAHAMRQLAQPISQRELAGCLGYDTSNITGIVDKLEERGLVERRIGATDRRVKNLVLTADGHALMDRLSRRLLRGNPVLDQLSEKDRTALRALLEKAAGPGAEPPPSWLAGPPLRRR